MVVVKSIDNSILGECKGKRVKVLNIILIGVFLGSNDIFYICRQKHTRYAACEGNDLYTEDTNVFTTKR